MLKIYLDWNSINNIQTRHPELYELIKMKKGVFLYSLDGFGNPNTGWIFIAQGENDIRFKFKDWRIDIEEEDVHKFCHVVRDFRNYIHPFEQNARQFSPDINTAKICLQVLKGAIAQINAKLKGGGK